MISGPPIEPEPVHAPRHEPGAVHHVAEDQPVPQADDPARPEEERPVLDRRERVGDRALGRARRLLLQRGDPEHRDDADEDERGLEDPRRHVADRQLLELPPHDRDDHDRGADVREDEQQLQQRAEVDLVDVPGARDEGHRMTKRRLVEQQRRDRRGERDEVEHAEPPRPLLIKRHACTPFPGDGGGRIPGAAAGSNGNRYASTATSKGRAASGERACGPGTMRVLRPSRRRRARRRSASRRPGRRSGRSRSPRFRAARVGDRPVERAACRGAPPVRGERDQLADVRARRPSPSIPASRSRSGGDLAAPSRPARRLTPGPPPSRRPRYPESSPSTHTSGAADQARAAPCRARSRSRSRRSRAGSRRRRGARSPSPGSAASSSRACARCGRREPPAQGARSFDGLLLGRRDPLDPSGGEVEQPVSSSRENGVALGRRLHLDEPAVAGHDDVEVDLRARVLHVVEVEQRLAADDPDRDRGHRAGERLREPEAVERARAPPRTRRRSRRSACRRRPGARRSRARASARRAP